MKILVRATPWLVSLMVLGSSGSGHTQSTDWGVPLADPKIPGYSFPVPEATLKGWIFSNPQESTSINRHVWGLWKSLTDRTDVSVFGLANVPTYFTWLSPAEIIARGQSATTVRQFRLKVPRQFSKIPDTGLDSSEISALDVDSHFGKRALSVLEFVAYDPPAAKFASDQGLFHRETLKALYEKGNTQIPVFPDDAVAIKPAYRVMTAKHQIRSGGKTLFVTTAWPGTPSETTQDMAKSGYPERKWPGCIYIDIAQTAASSANQVDQSCKTPSDQNTYKLGDFINYQVTDELYKEIIAAAKALSPNGRKDVEEFKRELLEDLKVGDYVLLIGMHVMSREMAEWTWQTFYWTTDPDHAPLPSSLAIAAARPAELIGAPRHYAASITYQMIDPPQPPVGGINQGKPVIGFNPYFEAGFPASTFSIIRPILDPKTGQTYTGNLGIQTNCTTCHAMAAASFDSHAIPGYGTVFYLQRNDSLFSGTLQSDFLWSIPDDAIPVPTP